MTEIPKDNPVRRHLNAAEKRALKAAQIKRFVLQYGRTAQKGIEPNDRWYDREIEAAVRRMSPEQLDELMRDDED
jgi:predicted aminopeptidase